MPELIPQSVAKRVALKAYTTDHVTAATGKTIAITISKNGAAFGNPSGGATNAVEIASGWYYVDLTTTDTGTLGPLIVLGTASGVDPVEQVFTVANAFNAGFTGIPGVIAEGAGGLYTRGAGAGQINQNAAGQIDTRTVAMSNGVIAAATFAANALDAVWSTATRILTAGTNIVLAKGVGITGFNDLSSAQVQSAADAAITANALVTAIKAKTDQLTFTVANKLDATIQLASDFAQAAADKVWLTAARTLTAFGFSVTVGTNNDKTGYTTTAADQQNSADEFLNRNLQGGGSGGARLVRGALRALRNRRRIAAGTLTVYAEDDATPDWTAPVTTSPGNPVSEIDPA